MNSSSVQCPHCYFTAFPTHSLVCHNLHHTFMDEITNATAPEPAFSGRWIAKLILAVILAEAIWAFIVSLTNSLILPALARVMGGDPQSPLYLGKGDFNVPAIFSSFLELCLAGIAAVLLNHWSGPRPVAVRVKTTKMGTVAAKASIPSISQQRSCRPR